MVHARVDPVGGTLGTGPGTLPDPGPALREQDPCPVPETPCRERAGPSVRLASGPVTTMGPPRSRSTDHLSKKLSNLRKKGNGVEIPQMRV